MKESFTFGGTALLALALISLWGLRRKDKPSRYERNSHQPNDWQKLDKGIDPSE